MYKVMTPEIEAFINENTYLDRTSNEMVMNGNDIAKLGGLCFDAGADDTKAQVLEQIDKLLKAASVGEEHKLLLKLVRWLNPQS
jgi:hypothetical protein